MLHCSGKCANRLAAPSGAPAVARQLMRLKLNSIWALAVAFDGPVPAPFEGGRGASGWQPGDLRRLGICCCSLLSNRHHKLPFPKHMRAHTCAFTSGLPTLC